MNKDDETMWVAEYNPESKMFHITLMGNKIMKSVRAIRKGVWKGESKWMIVEVGTEEECELACDVLKNKL